MVYIKIQHLSKQWVHTFIIKSFKWLFFHPLLPILNIGQTVIHNGLFIHEKVTFLPEDQIQVYGKLSGKVSQGSQIQFHRETRLHICQKILHTKQLWLQKCYARMRKS